MHETSIFDDINADFYQSHTIDKSYAPEGHSFDVNDEDSDGDNDERQVLPVTRSTNIVSEQNDACKTNNRTSSGTSDKDLKNFVFRQRFLEIKVSFTISYFFVVISEANLHIYIYIFLFC